MSKRNLSQHPYRPDIDGLRALAVLSVLLFHAFPEWIHGGFIGVDIFFVISGYLISSIILKELDRQSFSFYRFYLRRIKRIFPALILVLIFSLIVGWFTLLSDEYKQLGKHVLGASTFANNLMFWQESGYFDNESNTKPLLHLWSLSIEEQFYLVWPLILWFIYKHKKHLSKIILGLTICFTLLHFYIFHPDRVAAFYAPYARFFELLIGAYIGHLHFYKEINPSGTLNKRFQSVQPYIGLFLILLGINIITKESHFPGWYALLSPALGSALIINSSQDSIVNKYLFSNKIMVWIGLISYPLYLWHWPILSFAYIIESQTPSIEVRVYALLIAFTLATLTYYFIEKPIRFGNKKNIELAGIVLISILILNGLLGFAIYRNNGIENRDAATSSVKNDGDIGHEIFHKYPYKNLHLCMPLDLRGKALKWNDSIRCFQSKKNQPIDIAIIGDSHAEHLFIGLAEAAPNKNIVYYTRSTIPIKNNKEFNDIFDYVVSDKNIKTVILNAYWKSRKNEFPKGSSLLNELTVTGNYLASNGKKVFIANDVPDFSFNPKACKYTRPFSNKNNCKENKKVFFEKYSKYQSVFEDLKKEKILTVIDTLNFLCDNSYCFMANEGKLLFRDKDHLNINGSKFIGAKLTEKYPLIAK